MSQQPEELQPGVNPEFLDFPSFMMEFIAESDRAAVVLGAAKVDALLYALLERVLLPYPDDVDDLLDGEAPLSTFSARIRACHRLGLIDTQFAKLLHILRKLRNGFAHDIGHSSLAVGSARDRVLAMAEPFKDALFYQKAVAMAAGDSRKQPDDVGVIFRAVLSIFCMELYVSASKGRRGFTAPTIGIVERAMNAQRGPASGGS